MIINAAMQGEWQKHLKAEPYQYTDSSEEAPDLDFAENTSRCLNQLILGNSFHHFHCFSTATLQLPEWKTWKTWET